jgi:hypothetical protein
MRESVESLEPLIKSLEPLINASMKPKRLADISVYQRKLAVIPSAAGELAAHGVARICRAFLNQSERL